MIIEQPPTGLRTSCDFSFSHLTLGGPHAARLGGPHVARLGGPHAARLGGPHAARLGGPHAVKVPNACWWVRFGVVSYE